jgi:hypothetical protein
MVPDLQGLRLAFKKAFTGYFLALCSPAIADPTEAFGAGFAYLEALWLHLGPSEFMHRLDDETTLMAGEIEQEIVRASRKNPANAYVLGPDLGDDLEDRLRECFEYALDRLNPREATEGSD